MTDPISATGGFPDSGSTGSTMDGGAGKPIDGSAGTSVGGSAGTSVGGSAGTPVGGSAGHGDECGSEHHCVPVVDGVWKDFGYKKERGAKEHAFPCGNLERFELFRGLKDNGCSCACAMDPGEECILNDWKVFEDENCQGEEHTLSSDCDATASSWAIMSVQPGTVKYSAHCGASAHASPPAWEFAVDLCHAKPTEALCSSGHICIPEPPSVDWDRCIHREGEHDCPSKYPEKSVYYENYQDTRQCDPSPCSCQMTAGSCKAEMGLWFNDSCTGESNDSFPLGEECETTNYSVGAILGARVLKRLHPGSCEASGNAKQNGKLAPVAPHTLCCQSKP